MNTKAGGISRHDSALELMEHTANFYHDVVLKRLLTTFSSTSDGNAGAFSGKV